MPSRLFSVRFFVGLMMCQIADRLRHAWYATAKQMDGYGYPLPADTLRVIDRQRGEIEFQQALENLRQHFMECEVCNGINR